ncbi:hypothetical protein G7Y89_g10528 [Cudoniella acicularis]|uniref:Uncharacterized protein n=1 Tax=Cudoniella acicularis TaxID=354080 RepID=A0A8H4VYY3_9HELO|nr:hypothetical protein G7Y89_g10528 [Cudoniella acicularis]
MGNNKRNKRAVWNDDFYGPGNEDEYESQSRDDRTQIENEGENSSNRQIHPAANVMDGEAGFNLKSYTDNVQAAIRAINTVQEKFQTLNDCFVKQVQDIEMVPEIHQQLTELQIQCASKDTTITKQQSTIEVLHGMRQESEAKLAKRKAKIEEEESALEREKKEQGEKIKKAEKSIEAKKAEIKYELEKEYKKREVEQNKAHMSRMEQLENKSKKQGDEQRKKLRGLENENKNLSENVERKQNKVTELEKQLEIAKEKYEMMETAATSYKKQAEDLKTKLEETGNEFEMTSMPADFYKDMFENIWKDIEKTSRQYFKDLPAKVTENLEEIQKQLISNDSCFNSIPISDSETSQNLRVAHAQRIISSALYTNIWQPFSCEKLTSSPTTAEILIEICTELAKSEHSGSKGRAAIVWKVLTLRALQSIEPSNAAAPPQGISQPSKRENQAVQAIHKKLSPLIARDQETKIQEALHRIAQSAVEVWTQAQTDELKLTAFLNLDLSKRSAWRSPQFYPLKSAGDKMSEADINPSTRPRVFTLFPRIIAHSLSTKTDASVNISSSVSKQQQEFAATEADIHQGVGLAESSDLVMNGKSEKEEGEAFVRLAAENAMKEIARGGKRNSVRSRTGSMVEFVSGPKAADVK